MRRSSLLFALLLVGCARENPEFNGDGQSTGDVPSTTSTASDTGVDRPPSTSEGTTRADTSDSEPATTLPDADSSGDEPPLCFEDIGEPCDPYSSIDCPQGQKCSPLANLDDGEGARCIPLVGGPTNPGDPCSWECEGTQDDCGFDQLCIPENDGDPVGVCIGLCQEPDPCPLPNTLCVDLEQFGLCLLACDPLDPTTCPPQGLCVPFEEGFACVGPEEDDVGDKGDECFEHTECAFGLACIPAKLIPGCEDPGGTGVGCCSPYCSPDNSTCPLNFGCAPFEGPPKVPDLGVCVGSVGN